MYAVAVSASCTNRIGRTFLASFGGAVLGPTRGVESTVFVYPSVGVGPTVGLEATVNLGSAFNTSVRMPRLERERIVGSSLISANSSSADSSGLCDLRCFRCIFLSHRAQTVILDQLVCNNLI